MLPMIALLVEMAQFFQGQVVLHEHANTLENNGTSGWIYMEYKQYINTTFTSYNGFLSHILLPCLSLFQGCRFFPQSETTSCVRTAVGILIVPIGTTCLCCRKYGTLWLRNPLSKIGNVAYTVCPNPSRENVLWRRRCCWWRWLFHSWYGFFLRTAPSYPL